VPLTTFILHEFWNYVPFYLIVISITSRSFGSLGSVIHVLPSLRSYQLLKLNIIAGKRRPFLIYTTKPRRTKKTAATSKIHSSICINSALPLIHRCYACQELPQSMCVTSRDENQTLKYYFIFSFFLQSENSEFKAEVYL
jgi:hypothetical protein